jgi:hypothetical protein
MPKKTLVLLLVMWVVMASAGEARAQEVSWIRQFGTSGFDTTGGIAGDSNHVYVTGSVGFDLAFPGLVSAGGVDTFVRKLDAAGADLWTTQFGTSGFDGFSKVAIVEGSLYVAGLTTRTFEGQSSAGGDDIFIRQYDLEGNSAWTRQFGTSGNDRALGITAHADGVYVFGSTTGVFPTQTSAGGSDFFVAKLDFGGSLLWVRQFGTSSDDPARIFLGGIAVDYTGVYVGSGVALALPGQTSVGDVDAFLRKYDFHGNELWTTQFGTACRDRVTAVAVHSSGMYVAGGTFGEMANPFSPRCTNPQPIHAGRLSSTFVQRRTADGTVLWTQQYDDGSEGSSGLPTGFSLARGLAVGDTGVFVVSEAIRAGNPGALDQIDPACPPVGPNELDIHVRMHGLEGETIWTQLIGSTAIESASDITVNATGVYVAGTTGCQLAGQVSAGSAGSADAVVIKLTP